MVQLQECPFEEDVWGDLYVVIPLSWHHLLTVPPSPELAVEFFEGGEYANGTHDVPPLIVPFDVALCQISRGTIDSVTPPVWITTMMTRVCALIYFT